MRHEEEIPQSRNRMPFWGLFCGMAVILGLPLITLTAGANLADWVQLVLILMALLVGSVMAAIATFFGIVLPYARTHFAKYWGLACGMTVMLGMPYLILTKGAHLAEWMQVTLVVVAILAGSLMALTAVFFGIVIPQAKVRIAQNGGFCFTRHTCDETEERADRGEGQGPAAVKPGVEQVRVDEHGVHVTDGKQSVTVSSAGVKVEG